MSKFQPIEFYRRTESAKSYELLPFRFTTLDSERYVVSNLAGEYTILGDKILRAFVNHELAADSDSYVELRRKHFLTDQHTKIARDLLAIKVRTRYERLAEFTALHIFVVTLRCEHSCPYCQVSRQSEDKSAFDMSDQHADAAIGLALRSPSPRLKFEFQGGEPLLNFELIKYIVTEAKHRASGKDLSFVIATNLALLSDEVLEFCKEHDIYISTSLDGPKALHNGNRPRPGGDSYERTIAGIKKVRDALGRDKVSALMTTTAKSLADPRGIVDEYLSQGFDSIFLRPLSPYGFAIKTKTFKKYTAASWMDFYKAGLDYVIELNRSGIAFREHYASLVLAKMLTSTDPGYVDLMSPSGIGIGAVVYNYDGSVYASDESRMLAEMGDHTFRMGHVASNSYEELFSAPALLDPIEQSFAYSVPQCTDCAFEPYCGADPVYHWAQHRDYVGRKPESDFCARNMEIFRHLIRLMDSDSFVRRLFMNWAN